MKDTFNVPRNGSTDYSVIFPRLINFKTSYIFVVGGIHVNQQSRKVLRYCIQTGKWNELPPMILANRKVTACTIKNFIYVLGGNGSRPNSEFTIEKLSNPASLNP